MVELESRIRTTQVLLSQPDLLIKYVNNNVTMVEVGFHWKRSESFDVTASGKIYKYRHRAFRESLQTQNVIRKLLQL